jgi:hypothetical protein
MRRSEKSRKLGGRFLIPALLLGLGTVLTFGLIMAPPVAADDDDPTDITGIMSGGGAWVFTKDPDINGFTYFSMRANFPGQADGGFMYFQGESGWFRVALDADRVTIADGTWTAFNESSGVSVIGTGKAIWGIGQIVAADHPCWGKGGWAFVGVFDGSSCENCEDETDYLLCIAGDPRSCTKLPEGYAMYLYTNAIAGNQLFPFEVFLVQGNAVLNVLEE